MSYSTTQNYTNVFSHQINTKIAGRFMQYPNDTGTRKLEIGLRMQGKYKRSLPNKPLLSVITVCFNSAKTIEKCVLSVLEQDYDNVEYIVIDGGSTDGTIDILRKYEDAIDYIISEEDKGHREAMNKGIALASGDAINIMNSDDRFMPHVLKEYAGIFNNSQIKVVYAFVNNIDEIGNIKGQSTTTFDSVFFDCVAHQTVFIKNELVERIGYLDGTYPIAFDAKFLMQAYLQCAKDEIFLLEKPTVFYFDGGISGVQTQQYCEEFVNLSYHVYGKHLGLSEELIAFIYNHRNEITLPENLAQLCNTDTVLRALFSMKISPENYELFITLISQYCHYANLDRGYIFLQSELSRMQDNWWYKFGQVSKGKKLFMLLKKMIGRS